VSHFPMLGWAKPTPVNPRNFKDPVWDDILTSVAGPVSNFMVASAAVILLLGIKNTSALGQQIVTGIPFGIVSLEMNSPLVPASLLLYQLMTINIVLGVFNLIPIPPLDGSHVLRHFLSGAALKIYDNVGMFALMALVFLGGGLLGRIIFPVVGIFNYLLLRVG